MISKFIIAIKNNSLTVWLRIIMEKISESFLLTRFN